MSYIVKRKELGLWSNTSNNEGQDGEELFRVHKNGDITKVERRGKEIFQKNEIINSKEK